MGEDSSAEGIIPDDDLTGLVHLFRQFEGAPDPISSRCREIEWEFNSLVDTIYSKEVKPKFQSVSLSQFRSYVRNYCRRRLSLISSVQVTVLFTPRHPCISHLCEIA